MENLNKKLEILQDKLLQSDEKIKIMIIGLGSVGLYLFDYLVSTSNPRLELIVAGRNFTKMESDVNIIKTAATIRHQLRSKINIESDCDLENIEDITTVIEKWNPDFIVNTSRVYAGLKYGSISWSKLRAYGIWTPLAVKYAANIMLAYEKTNCNAITINTSYSDAVIPWLKYSGITPFDFGSGNLNHLIPRIKFYISRKFGIENLNEIDVTLAVSHFHDVVISKEGQSEGQSILLSIKYQGKELDFNLEDLLSACKIAMPVDQKRNMMNASSNFEIIQSVLKALSEKKRIKIHTPGVGGLTGGYPVIIDGRDKAFAYVDTSEFSMEEMEKANRMSIYLDGIENVSEEGVVYTDELLSKVQNQFKVNLPKKIPLDKAQDVRNLIINKIILPSLK